MATTPVRLFDCSVSPGEEIGVRGQVVARRFVEKSNRTRIWLKDEARSDRTLKIIALNGVDCDSGDVVVVIGIVIKAVIQNDSNCLILQQTRLEIVLLWRDVSEETFEVAAQHQKDMASLSIIHCKNWLLTGNCSRVNCPYKHDPTKKKDVTTTIHRPVPTSSPYDLQRLQISKSRHERILVFCQWLIDKFSIEALGRGSGILDIAGGRGDITFFFETSHKIRSTLIDPKPRTLSAQQQQLLSDNQQHLTDQLCMKFEDAIESEHQERLKNCSIVVGMHPDQATESIVDFALLHNKSFAILPCCVFAKSNPDRKLPNGLGVESYTEFVDYLLLKHPSILREKLNFYGRNQVLYRQSVGDRSSQHR